MSVLTESVAVKPVAPWVGGKSLLAKVIIEKIESVPHACYAEPFIGMGGIFLRRSIAAKSEVINDYSKDVSNLFRILQRHYVPFMEMMRFQITTRTEFERLSVTNPDTLTDLERAARFLYLQRTCFGGKPEGRVYGLSKTTSARFDITKLAPMLEDLHTRLSSVVIECLPYDKFLQRYDGKDTFFYLDPPYYNCEDYYGKGMFDKTDFETIATILKSCQSKFLMSLNDTPEIRKIYSAFNIEKVKTVYSLAGKNRKKKSAGEAIISNT